LAARVPARLSPAEGRRFGVTVGLAFLVFAALAWWRDHRVVASVLGAVGGLLVLAAAVIPGQLGPVQRGWMGLAHAISRVTTPVFMGILYFAVLTPFGIVRRTFGRSPLHRSRTATTFWIARPSRRSDLTRQF
jgi:hypothetical protein